MNELARVVSAHHNDWWKPRLMASCRKTSQVAIFFAQKFGSAKKKQYLCGVKLHDLTGKVRSRGSSWEGQGAFPYDS